MLIFPYQENAEGYGDSQTDSDSWQFRQSETHSFDYGRDITCIVTESINLFAEVYLSISKLTVSL